MHSIAKEIKKKDNNDASDLLKHHTVLRQVAHLLWPESYTVCYNVCDLNNFLCLASEESSERSG